MATIHVDGKEYEVNGADNLLEACLSLGLDIPYFCGSADCAEIGFERLFSAGLVAFLAGMGLELRSEKFMKIISLAPEVL